MPGLTLLGMMFRGMMVVSTSTTALVGWHSTWRLQAKTKGKAECYHFIFTNACVSTASPCRITHMDRLSNARDNFGLSLLWTNLSYASASFPWQAVCMYVRSEMKKLQTNRADMLPTLDGLTTAYTIYITFIYRPLIQSNFSRDA